MPGMATGKSHAAGPLAAALARLKIHKLKITEPRRAILEVLSADHGPFTAEEIHERVLTKSCDLTTVYRATAQLEQVGLLRRCEFGDRMARYELADTHHHHHHLICTCCRRVETLDDCDLQDLDRVAQKRGYLGVRHTLEFYGVCPDCAQRG